MYVPPPQPDGLIPSQARRQVQEQQRVAPLRDDIDGLRLPPYHRDERPYLLVGERLNALRLVRLRCLGVGEARRISADVSSNLGVFHRPRVEGGEQEGVLIASASGDAPSL